MKTGATWNGNTSKRNVSKGRIVDGSVWSGLLWLISLVALICVLVPFVCNTLDSCRRIKDQLDRSGQSCSISTLYLGDQYVVT